MFAWDNNRSGRLRWLSELGKQPFQVALLLVDPFRKLLALLLRFRRVEQKPVVADYLLASINQKPRRAHGEATSDSMPSSDC